MNMISRDERKSQKGLKKFINSFTYPIKGLKYDYRNEQNLAVDVGIAIHVVLCGLIFRISGFEWAILALTIGLVISCELINTAIEAVVDLITEEYHPLAKIAKDCGSASTCVATFMALIVNLIIFVPYFLALFK